MLTDSRDKRIDLRMTALLSFFLFFFFPFSDLSDLSDLSDSPSHASCKGTIAIIERHPNAWDDAPRRNPRNHSVHAGCRSAGDHDHRTHGE